jgi:hypothetical protein
MNVRPSILAVAFLLLGLGAGIVVTRALSSSASDESLQEVHKARMLLKEMLDRRSAECAPPVTAGVQPRSLSPCVSAATTQAAAPPTAAPQPDKEPEPTAENWAAFDAGNQIVSMRVANGHWTNHDERELSNLRDRMTPAQFFELKKRIAQAINQDKLVPEQLTGDLQ